ncbi:unnamed protein product [Microthlaspi erraticum]|uniref:RNase H type-1 domain-containing protein n=1 Tax=Microthlaspi erraticum TaxID=1685480 RepID=A0A6D2KI92_9BRAS|nr:unnamed protein product [Microthlaspi erraticum]
MGLLDHKEVAKLLHFEDRQFSPEETISKAVKEAREWQQAQHPTKTIQRRSNLSYPSVTNPNVYYLYTDGAWCKDACIGGAGWIFIDNEGTELHQARQRSDSSLPADGRGNGNPIGTQLCLGSRNRQPQTSLRRSGSHPSHQYAGAIEGDLWSSF